MESIDIVREELGIKALLREGVLVSAFNLAVQKQHRQISEFQASHGYLAKPCSKKEEEEKEEEDKEKEEEEGGKCMS